MEGVQLIELWFVGILSALRFDTVRTTFENCSSKKDRLADFRLDLSGFRVRTAPNRFISHQLLRIQYDRKLKRDRERNNRNYGDKERITQLGAKEETFRGDFWVG